MPDCLGCLPVTALRDSAERLTVSRREVGRLLEAGVLVRLDRYLVVGACRFDAAKADPQLAHRLEVEAMLAAYPECVASAHSAAVVHGLPTFELPGHATATRTEGAWRGGKHRVRIAPLPASHVATVDGLPVTSIARTVVDIARSASRRSSVVTGDAALRRGLRRDQLVEVLDECATWSDVGKARDAVAFMDPRAESALESLSRVVFDERDVPAPEPQVEIVLAAEVYRVEPSGTLATSSSAGPTVSCSTRRMPWFSEFCAACTEQIFAVVTNCGGDTP